VLLAHGLNGGVGQRIEHPVACACAYDEVVRERSNVLDVEQQDVLRLLAFESLYDRMSEIKRVQFSPLGFRA
jgi:hypothetical protein